MFAKHVLRAFNPNIQIKYYIDNVKIDGIDCVRDFMNNGLCNYEEVKDGKLEIINGTIIIKVTSNF